MGFRNTPAQADRRIPPRRPPPPSSQAVKPLGCYRSRAGYPDGSEQELQSSVNKTEIHDRTLASRIVLARNLFRRLRQAGYHSTRLAGIVGLIPPASSRR